MTVRTVLYRRVCVAAAVALLAVCASVSRASAAGFFESLFGVRQQPVAAPAPAARAPRDVRGREPRGKRAARAKERQRLPAQNDLFATPSRGSAFASLPQDTTPAAADRASRRKKSADRREKRNKVVRGEAGVSGQGVAALRFVRPQRLAGPYGHFLLDPTLRRGDIVVTTEGLKVFMGGASGKRAQHSNRDFVALARAGRSTAELRALEKSALRQPAPVVMQALAPGATRSASLDPDKDNDATPVVASDPTPPADSKPVEQRRVIDIR